MAGTAGKSRFKTRLRLLLLRCCDLVEISFGKIAVPNFIPRCAEPRIAGRFRARAEENHVLASGIVELVKLARRNGHQHPRIECPRGSVGKMKRALGLERNKIADPPYAC